MIVAQTTSGSIVFGEVLKWKKGSGSAENSLTILTVSDVQTRENIKVLCWNSKSKYGPKLSDRARKLQEGDRISVKGIFDIGDPDKCVASELKRSGIYKVTDLQGHNIRLIYGKIRSVDQDEFGNLRVMIPVYRYGGEKMEPVWWCITFPKLAKNFWYYKRHLRRGAVCFIQVSTPKNIKRENVTIDCAQGQRLTVVA